MKLLLLFLSFGLTLSLSAQQFDDAKLSFSKKKPLYITLQDGTEIEGTLDKVKRKKNFVKYIRIETPAGEEREIMVEDIATAYLPESGFTALLTDVDNATDIDRIADDSESRIVDTLIQNGYALFESHNVSIKGKKKERQLLLQVVNPGFANHVKVYLDPIAKEQMSAGIGPLSAGGGAKSYYVKWNDSDELIYLTKKIYRKTFSDLWKDCPKVRNRYKKNMDWDDLPKHVATAHDNCK